MLRLEDSVTFTEATCRVTKDVSKTHKQRGTRCELAPLVVFSSTESQRKMIHHPEILSEHHVSCCGKLESGARVIKPRATCA